MKFSYIDMPNRTICILRSEKSCHLELKIPDSVGRLSVRINVSLFLARVKRIGLATKAFFKMKDQKECGPYPCIRGVTMILPTPIH